MFVEVLFNMVDLESVLVAPLMEQPKSIQGWQKSTIDFAWKNKGKVMGIIKSTAKKSTKVLTSADYEDIYMECIAYMFNCDDYDISKACTGTSVVSLDGYVFTCVKYCTLRYITNVYKDEKHIQRDLIKVDEEGKEYSIFDTLADEKNDINIDGMMYKLDNICKTYEYQRYMLGADIFQLWFVRLKTISCGKRDKYDAIIAVLGISRKNLATAERNAVSDGIMFNIAKAISLVGIEKAIEILRKYTYCASKIERTIEKI